MNRLAIALLATVGFAAMAQAADLPTTKAPAPAAKIDCWSSFWNWLNNSATDCPLSAYGVTLYGTLDLNAFYAPEGAQRSPSATQPYLRHPEARASTDNWQFGYNGLSTSVVGVKIKEDILPVRLVADRRPRGRRQPVFRHVPQWPAIARRQQRPAADDLPLAVDERRLRAGPASGTTRRPISASATRRGAP